MTPLLKFAFRNLLTRPLRTVLSLIGLTVAIMAMVGLFSVAEGLDRMVDDTFGRIPGLLAVQPGAPIPLFSKLPSAWGDEIAEVDGVSVVNTEVWSRAQLIEGKQVFSPPRFFFGTDIPTRAKLRYSMYREAIVEGRFLGDQDVGTMNTLISRQIADEFDKKLGDTLRVDGNTLTIVGIYQCNSLFLDIAIILDIDAVRRFSRIGADTACAFYIELDPEANHEQVLASIRDRFRGRKLDAVNQGDLSRMMSGQTPATGWARVLSDVVSALSSPQDEPTLPPKDSSSAAEPDESSLESPLEVRTVSDWMEDFERFSADLDIFLVIMTGIGVTIAVVSILNTMLMSVTERYIEFGILKANGWSRRDILTLITLESGMLGVSGGVMGSAIGWAATLVINHFWADRVYLYAGPGLIAFSIAFSTGLGILGGLYPAWLAAKMTPMQAIRRG